MTTLVKLHYKQVLLKDEFRILLDRLVYSIAQDGRYLGDGKIKINKIGDYKPWQKHKRNKKKNGIYIRGDVISNSAKIVKMKDSTTRVSVKHEIALEPGILVLDQLLDPFNDNRVKIDGDEVKSFPTLEKFNQS